MDLLGPTDGAQDGNRTRMTVRSADFKSAVSTNFTTRAGRQQLIIDAPLKRKREARGFPFSYDLERETRLELATSTLARLRSTN